LLSGWDPSSFHRQDQQIFHRQDQETFHRQDQQILRLPAAAKSLQPESSSTMAALRISSSGATLCISSSGGILKFFIDKNRHAAVDYDNNLQH
jgi:hypothetical protein